MVHGGTAHAADDPAPDDSSAGRRVLVVDDEPAIAGLIQAVLSRRGYRVKTSEGGEDALLEATSGNYELVISDYAIPGMSGLEFARRLKGRRPEARVLIVSAFLDHKTVEEMDAEPNVVGLIRKPFDIFELTARVDEQFGGRPPGSGSSIGGSSAGGSPSNDEPGSDAGPPPAEDPAPAPPFMDPGAFH